MKNHFLFAYSGNKRCEVEQIADSIDFTDKTTIIEPFCGTCAFSVYMSMKYPKKFKYIINDNNKHLVELFKLVKDKKKFDKFIEDINNTCFNDDKFMTKEQYNEAISQDTLKAYYIAHKFYCIRSGLYPIARKGQRIKPECAFNDFIRSENVEVCHEDACKIMDKYIDDEKTVLFVDPPYMNSCNDFYLSPDVNIYEYM